MKQFVLAALLATVSAEKAYKCAFADGVTPTAVVAADGTAITIENCGAEGTKVIEALTDKADNDHCLQLQYTPAVEEVKADDGTVTTEAAAATLTSCAYAAVATGDDTDIRTATADTAEAAYEAWAWAKGELLPELAPPAEGDADSAKMITSALAAVATIAMVAY